MTDELPPDSAEQTLPSLPRGPQPHEASPGGLFAGRYALEALVGHGGMGKVYRARDTLVGDLVALKTLELGRNPTPDAIERFRREVRLARRISHPNIARMHDLGEHAGRHYLTMEYVDGGDLRTLLEREGPLSPVRTARLGLAVCEGLAAAHAAGVMHRDLKPANVLVEKGGRVVLTDFGIARALASEGAARTQGTAGTPMYMAPEQLGGGTLDERADLYSAGLMLYELLTASLPFTGDSPTAVAFARLRQPPPDPRTRAPVPDALAELVLRCLSREPEGRPASALELAQALRAWLESTGEQTPEGPHSQLGPRPVTPPPSSATALPETLTPARSTSWSSTLSGALGVAILPLRFLGPREQEYLGEAFTDGLIDSLSRTRGLRVPGSGATARFRQEREPRTVGRELGVGFLVDGMLQGSGPMLRLSVRLVDALSGTQLWSGRFEDSSTDVFEQQERLCQRAAEALRVELLVAAWSHAVTPEALSLYRQALVQGYTPGFPPDVALGWLEECLTLSPGFGPALALHAIFSLRKWFMGVTDPRRDWAAEARASVARVEQHAPELAETYLARAMLSGQEGDWRQAVLSARAALEAAPTFALALQYLGSLKCEAGHADEGLVHLRQAYALDSRLGLSLFELARCSALRGDMEAYRDFSQRLSAFTSFRVPSLMLRLRVAAWTGDLDTVRQLRRELEDETSISAGNGLRYARIVLGELPVSDSVGVLDTLLGQDVNPRFASLMCQLATEQLCLSGHPERALDYFLRAADSALIDLEWTDRCPALAPLRALPGFTEARRKVRARVEAIWNV
ncbi:MAG TPA: protein kinase [Myxococcaceae bacterium]|nr:protein kinase [Myxococcaceae bacterium]